MTTRTQLKRKRKDLAVLMSVDELAEETGESIGTISYYERVGLIESSAHAGSRRYDEGARLRVLIIRKGKRLGFSLQEIGRLIASRGQAQQQNEMHAAVSPGTDNDGPDHG